MLTEEQLIETLPEPQRGTVRALYAMRPEELPQKPEKNKWYYYRPEGCICANGRPYYSSLKLGTENKLIVLFCGGGVAVDAYAAARPDTIPPVEGEPQFYMQDTMIAGYLLGHKGIGDKDRAKNPFRIRASAIKTGQKILSAIGQSSSSPMRAEISTAAGMILCLTIPRRGRASALTAGTSITARWWKK